VDDAGPGHVRVGGRLRAADRDEPARRRAERAGSKGQIQPAVEGHDDGNVRRPRQEQADPLEVRVDHVEFVGPTKDVHHARDEIAGPRIGNLAGGSEGARDGRHQPRGGGRGIAGGEQRHVMPPGHQLADQRVDDALRAAVARRWHGLLRRCNLGDAQRAQCGRCQGVRHRLKYRSFRPSVPPRGLAFVRQGRRGSAVTERTGMAPCKPGARPAGSGQAHPSRITPHDEASFCNARASGGRSTPHERPWAP
jgi:hypothetical protein